MATAPWHLQRRCDGAGPGQVSADSQRRNRRGRQERLSPRALGYRWATTLTIGRPATPRPWANRHRLDPSWPEAAHVGGASGRRRRTLTGTSPGHLRPAPTTALPVLTSALARATVAGPSRIGRLRFRRK